MIDSWLHHEEAVPVTGGDSGDAPQGVLIHVEISPLDCVGVCGYGPLPTTGTDVEILASAAAVLLAIGVATLIVRSVTARRRDDRRPAAATPAPTN